MCGLVGFLSTGFEAEKGKQILQKMADKIAHRGPDASGVWFDQYAQIGLGHRRLSILDLSATGAQPMLSGSERYVIAFNGEIYNHMQLRRELGDNILWRGHSDTETLLAGFDSWGIKATIERTVGMFAFSVWDRHHRTLTLGRDRLGEKPLYYGWQQGHFLFGSELKALKESPMFCADVNRDALVLMMRHSNVPAPYSIWQGIHKLMPGCLLTVSHQAREPVITSYWSGKEAIEANIRSPFSGSPEEAVLELEKILLDTISSQMVADVPVGAFLSGGVDSSVIVALMQARSKQPVRSFSIGFSEESYNEATYAKEVARHIGTIHTELYVSSKDALQVIPKLSQLYDEPFSDSSQIPTFLVAQLAKQQVTVSLSGDGGDELFGGYNRYLFTNQLWNVLSKIHPKLRVLAGKAILAVPPRVLVGLLNPITYVLPQRYRKISLGDKLRKGAALLGSPVSDALYHQLISHWTASDGLVLGGDGLTTLFGKSAEQPCTLSDIEDMMALDMLTYLPDDILTKVDRAAMGCSLETRVPFLDHRVVEFAWSLPLKHKINNKVGKWVLREVLYKYVPKHLIERPKKGFGIPLGSWLRGPLRDWAETLLDEHRLKDEGFFNSKIIREKWENHLSGYQNCEHLIWDVLMFQTWFESNKSRM